MRLQRRAGAPVSVWLGLTASGRRTVQTLTAFLKRSWVRLCMCFWSPNTAARGYPRYPR